jgi:hypothetical protein
VVVSARNLCGGTLAIKLKDVEAISQTQILPVDLCTIPAILA